MYKHANCVAIQVCCNCSLQVRFHPKPGYMNKQPDITCGMRAILVDWLVEVADEFRMDPQTLYLAMSITDHFLSSMLVTRSKLQLVGITSLYIAAKLEEIYPPQLGEFAYITDNTYSKQQVRIESLLNVYAWHTHGYRSAHTPTCIS